MESVSIPNRPVFRAQDVCEIAGVPPYVLRGWEAEFPDLGTTKASTGTRTYRREDVERVLRLKHLILVDGLTLAGARRRLMEEAEVRGAAEAAEAPAGAAPSAAPEGRALAPDAVAHLTEVRRGLEWILARLDGAPTTEEFVLAPEAARPKSRRRKAGM